VCGILAAVGVNAEISDPVATNALELLRHRGPDDHGLCRNPPALLANRRLSIIDLGPRGHQPFADPQTGVAITFNGEIYNYIELRQELEAVGHSFRTRTDTEVLLHAYLEWGQKCLARCNGMWAFVIWDPRNEETFFSRDRMGVKPLYYTSTTRGMAIASEPKALLALDANLRRVDEVSLYEFLAEGRLYASRRSFYEGIRILPPAHYGVYRIGAEPMLTRYWRPPFDEVSEDLAVAERFEEVFADSVRLRLRSDVPVGITLSGGLDSTAVLAQAMRQLGSGTALRAYTSVYRSTPGEPVVDERAWARRAASAYPQVEVTEVEVTRAEWLKTLREIVWHMDGPGSSPAVYPLWAIMHRARQDGVPVLLEGQGADELLGGYTQYAALDLIDQLSALAQRPSGVSAQRLARDFGAYQSVFSARMLTLWLVREGAPWLIAPYRRRIGALGVLRTDFVQASRGRSEPLPAAPPTSGRLPARLAADLTRDILPGLLQYGDAVSMAHSIETRYPFLDYRLVELCLRLPSSWKVKGGETKRVLRTYLRTVGQSVVADRREKLGYPTPADYWLAEHAGRLARQVLLSKNARIAKYCDLGKVARLITHHSTGGRGAGNHLYRLLTSELWLQRCF
jgi:asparagine synthase (glutamine-hydrolysing)